MSYDSDTPGGSVDFDPAPSGGGAGGNEAVESWGPPPGHAPVVVNDELPADPNARIGTGDPLDGLAPETTFLDDVNSFLASKSEAMLKSVIPAGPVPMLMQGIVQLARAFGLAEEPASFEEQPDAVAGYGSPMLAPSSSPATPAPAAAPGAAGLDMVFSAPLSSSSPIGSTPTPWAPAAIPDFLSLGGPYTPAAAYVPPEAANPGGMTPGGQIDTVPGEGPGSSWPVIAAAAGLVMLIGAADG